MDFLNMSLHKTVMSSSVTQHWWRSRTSRFFKLAKWAVEALKPPPISLLHEMSNFLSSARCCKAVSEMGKGTGWSLAATTAQVRALAFIYFNVKVCTRYCRQSSWAKLQCIITADTVIQQSLPLHTAPFFSGTAGEGEASSSPRSSQSSAFCRNYCWMC